MSTSELLDQLTKLERSEREKVWQKLEELELADIEEDPRNAHRDRCSAFFCAGW